MILMEPPQEWAALKGNFLLKFCVKLCSACCTAVLRGVIELIWDRAWAEGEKADKGTEDKIL